MSISKAAAIVTKVNKPEPPPYATKMETVAMWGESYGLTQRDGESTSDFRDRILACMLQKHAVFK